MFRLNREVALPSQWQDERIRSAAALLSLDAGVEIHEELADTAEEYLAEMAARHGLDPDQIHRALREHEPFLGFQEKDEALAEVAFRNFFHW